MNAYNIFWENGTWINGNWYGSEWKYDGKLEDPFILDILHNGMSWSNNELVHIWNIFKGNIEDSTDVENSDDSTRDLNSYIVNNAPIGGFDFIP